MRRFVLAVLAVSALGSCVQYDFEPVEPTLVAVTPWNGDLKVTKLRPNIAVLLDRSGSMELPIDAANPACPAGCGQSGQAQCPAACPTRISEVRRGMGQFLTSPARSLARWGFAAFPENAAANQCSATASLMVPLPAAAPNDDDPALNAAWDQGALDVNARLQVLTTGGGTPTAPSLAFLGASFLGARPGASPAAREDVVLLLTDGLPNCNASNPSSVCTDTSPAQVSACACTTGPSCAGPGLCSLGCLDQGAVGAVTALKSNAISTVVVGFGADTAASGAAGILNSMAHAGGYPRKCRVDADCGPADTCGGGVCGRAYYQASTATELTAVLNDIKQAINDPEKWCRVQLPVRATDERFISVRFNGQYLRPGPDTWRYEPAGPSLRFYGLWCDQILASTPATPVSLRISIAEHF